MKTLPVVLASLCLAFGTWAAEPPAPCASPGLLDGSFTMSTSEGNTNGRFTYDGLGQQLRVRSYGVVNNTASGKDLLVIFSEGVAYDIDYRNATCKKQKLNSKFSPMGVPEYAAFASQVVLGSSSSTGMGMLVNNWNGLIFQTDGKLIGYHTSAFSAFGCLPLSSTFYTPGTQWASISFYNIMLGVMNPMDFMTPNFCEYATLESAEKSETNLLDGLLSMARKRG